MILYKTYIFNNNYLRRKLIMENRTTSLDLAARLAGHTITWRRWFHEHPESSHKEIETTEKISQILNELGIPFKTAGPTGLVGVIKGTSTGPVIGLRADIDALEIEEQTSLPFASKNKGIMHACGHDGHMAALLTAAEILSQERSHLPCTVKLIFQPAEEIGDGAQTIVNSGLIDDVEAFYGFHVSPALKVGQISVVNGPVMAGSNGIRITLTGKSGHGASPHLAVDSVVAASALVQSLQQIASRESDPVEPSVLSIGYLHAGTRGNIIANNAELRGTLRVVTEESRERLSKAVLRIIRHVAEAYRVKADAICKFSTPIMVNDEQLYHIAFKSVCEILSNQAVVTLPIEMMTDDFAVYRQIAPIFYAKVGVASSEVDAPVFPLHHEKFTLDESSLTIASALFVEFVKQHMKGHV
jgi:amidohydrolase